MYKKKYSVNQIGSQWRIREYYVPEYPENVRLVIGKRNQDALYSQIFDHFKIEGGPYYCVERDLAKNKIDFLDKANFYLYDYSFAGVQEYNGRQVYKIEFDQKDKVKKPLYKGELYIDVQSLAFIHFEYGLSPKGLKFATGDLYIRKILKL